MQAIRIIVSEHRALAAILHGMQYLAHQIRDRRAKPDFALLEAMLCYIETFPERFHHPEQDECLFRRLRSRCPSAAPLIDRLRMEHRVGAEKLRTLEQALAHYQQGQKDEFSDFLAAVEACASFHWQHMRAEETQLLPLAEKYLSVSDWEEIDAAFGGYTDPNSMRRREAKTQRCSLASVNIASLPIGPGQSSVRHEGTAFSGYFSSAAMSAPTSWRPTTGGRLDVNVDIGMTEALNGSGKLSNDLRWRR